MKFFGIFKMNICLKQNTLNFLERFFLENSNLSVRFPMFLEHVIFSMIMQVACHNVLSVVVNAGLFMETSADLAI